MRMIQEMIVKILIRMLMKWVEGFHVCGGDMTMVLQNVMMLVTEVVVLISWMSNT